MVNLKPYLSLPFNSESLQYTLGISSKQNSIDQKRNIIKLLPGYQTVIKVIPQLIGTSDSFDEMEPSSRNCKLPFETEGLVLVKNYTRIGCEFECAAAKAVALCRCMPWYYSNSFARTPICDSFSAHCFDQIMSNEKYYKDCPKKCIEDCKSTPMIVVTNYLPIDTKDKCKKGGFFYTHFIQSSKQHFAFENYKALITGDGQIPDLYTSLVNGSLCNYFIGNYVSMVSIESPTDSVTKSERDVRVKFIDQLGTIGGTLGLFTGMSILSIIEVAFFTFQFFASFCKVNKGDLKSFIEMLPGIGRNRQDMDSEKECGVLKESKCNKCSELEEELNYVKEEIKLIKELIMPTLPIEKQKYLQDWKEKCQLSKHFSPVEVTKEISPKNMNKNQVSSKYLIHVGIQLGFLKIFDISVNILGS